MPRLADLLEFLGQPEQEHIWLLLDLKVGSARQHTAPLRPLPREPPRRHGMVHDNGTAS